MTLPRARVDEYGSAARDSFRGAAAMRRLLAIFIWALGTVFCALGAQTPSASPDESQTQLPSISFTLDFPGSDPDHYSFKVDSNGHSRYESTARISPDSEDRDSFQLDFDLSAATRAKVFDLAARAKYFQEQPDSRKHRVASTGKKTLAYKDAAKNGQITFDYSPSAPVQEITAVFQTVSTTLEFGRRLSYDYHYQKLALDQELKRMEELVNSHSLYEVQAVAQVLRQIADDPSVINVVRSRAQRLLAGAGGAAPRL